MFLNLISTVLAEGDTDKHVSFFANFEITIMNICSSVLNAGANILGYTGLHKIFNFDLLYILMMINLSSALTFAGIIHERFGVIFFMTIFTHTFLGYFNGIFTWMGEGVGISPEFFRSLFAFVFCASFLVFYAIIKPLFMGMTIFLVYNAIAESIGAVHPVIHLLFFIAIVVVVQLFFKLISRFYKYMVIFMFALYGSLLLMSSFFAFIHIPIGFDEYLEKFIDQKSVWGPMVESWNTVVWIILIILGVSGQVALLDNRHESEDKNTETEKDSNI